MSADFNAMTDRELKRYFLKHRDNESFHAYMDRRYARSDRETISPDDPEWEAKLAASVERQIRDSSPPLEVGARNLNYDRYKGYAIAIEKIKPLGGRWNYAAKPLKLESGKPHPRWEYSQTEVYGEDIDDAVRQCKEEIDKLLNHSQEGARNE